MLTDRVGLKEIRKEYPGKYDEQAAGGLAERSRWDRRSATRDVGVCIREDRPRRVKTRPLPRPLGHG